MVTARESGGEEEEAEEERAPEEVVEAGKEEPAILFPTFSVIKRPISVGLKKAICCNIIICASCFPIGGLLLLLLLPLLLPTPEEARTPPAEAQLLAEIEGVQVAASFSCPAAAQPSYRKGFAQTGSSSGEWRDAK